jgi:hypothetical protein
MPDVRHRQRGEAQGYDMGRFQRIVGGDSDRITGVWRVLNSDPQNERGKNESLIWPIDVTTWDSPDHRSGMTFSGEDFSARIKGGAVEVSDYRLASNRKAELHSVMDELVPLLLVVAEAARYDTEQAPYTWGQAPSGADGADGADGAGGES